MLSAGIKYDPIKEEKQLFEAKQQELKRIEEAKRKVADQGKENNKNGNKKSRKELNIYYITILFSSESTENTLKI